MLTAEIIATGSELLTPDRTDTNSLWLTERLNSIGIEVKLKTIVGDDDVRMEEAMRDALKRSSIVITTGGLGPTEDDVTRKVAARALNRRLQFNDAVLENIRAKFTRLNREMPEINSRQAMIVEGAQLLDNPHGSAPGMYIEADKGIVACLPGPPREMKPMFDNFVLPKLVARAGEVRVARRTLRVAGMGESAVDERIAPVYKLYTNPQTTILFNRSEIEVNLTATARTNVEAELLLDGLAGQIEERLGEAVFAFRGETMEQIVGMRLAVKGLTVATAESCTGGLIAERLTDVAGSSVYFMEGVVTYSNDAKIRSLGVPEDLIATHGAVSFQVAEAMAEGIRRRANVDYGLSVTGIAGPGGGTAEKPVGLVYIALADDTGVEHRRVILPGDRQLIRWRASQAALDFLRRRLL
ncbi:MAG: competence/damage-inducible protein A [Pyrinomonadaceae bacterium MAG19_C2-C3]|nr:competence/damage-inducible protein A [Pyrinomonadaceae bacterium MAG19_C2-C3]